MRALPPGHPLADKSPGHLLTLALIPPNMMMHFPPGTKPGKVTNTQLHRIRGILNMGRETPFNRCKGKSAKALKALAKTGDVSHHEKSHAPCEQCRCQNKSGLGTKGDFYGLGPETGTLGVGYCRFCIQSNHIPLGSALATARHEVKMMQQYGSVSQDTDYALTVAKEEAALARQTVKVRDEMRLVRETLSEFKKQLEATDKEKRPTEPGKGGAMEMTDKTRIGLLLHIATVLSRLNMDAARLDEHQYVPIQAVQIAADELRSEWQNSIRLAEQLATQKAVAGECDAGNRSVSDYVIETANAAWVSVWTRVLKQCGKKGA
jgi:hypothetical protein